MCVGGHSVRELLYTLLPISDTVRGSSEIFPSAPRFFTIDLFSVSSVPNVYRGRAEHFSLARNRPIPHSVFEVSPRPTPTTIILLRIQIVRYHHMCIYTPAHERVHTRVHLTIGAPNLRFARKRFKSSGNFDYGRNKSFASGGSELKLNVQQLRRK